jgi:uncharacterized protein
MNAQYRKIKFTQNPIMGIKYYLIVTALCCWAIQLNAQQTNKPDANIRMANIHLIAQTAADSVVLRWAPSTAGGWSIANNLGYTVERVEIITSDELSDPAFERLNNTPLKPFSLDEWKSYAGPDNHLSAIAAQAVYGKAFIPEPLKSGELSALKNAADELLNRYSFALFAADNDPVTANALGLRYVDRDVKKGQKFAYRVFVAQATAEYAYDTAHVMVTVQETPKWPAPSNLAFESDEQNIRLTWNESALQSFSGYYIYRSDDGGKKFSKLNKIPMVMVSNLANPDQQPFFVDTLTVNYKKYHYRIYGITPFGELSEPAEIVAHSKDKTPPAAPHIHKPQQISSSQVKITWEMKEIAPDLQGFYVLRSANANNGFRFLNEKVLSKKTFEFTDKILGEPETYYCIAAVDTAGNLSYSPVVMAVLIDSIPPSVPQNLTGTIDENGKVKLSWDLGPEKNIIGYRVLRANDPTHEFIQLSGQVHTDTVFIDSINIQTLTRYVYYKIAAVNKRYQHSELTPYLQLKRPDKIPPSEAVFYDLFVSDSCVNLKWHCSASDDVARQLLYRKRDDDKTWNLLASLNPGISFYSDKDVLTNINYSYTIVSTDSSGLRSKEAVPVLARPYDTGIRKPVENMKADYNQESKTVQLTWDYTPEKAEKHWFVVYKSIGNGAYKEYKAIAQDQRSFVDRFPSKGQSGYGIILKTSKGGESEMVITELKIPNK